jgi:hypothetical protein
MHLASNQGSTVRETEKKFLKILYDQCKDLFAGSPLPSHDHTHHLRVWSFASDLLESLHANNVRFTSLQTGNLILAIFFHDTGLTRTLNEEHGHESRKICESFIQNNPGFFNYDISPALSAIEMHDNKAYVSGTPEKENINVLSILSVCDDLDAFGAIGVLRYAEIYLLRKISIDELSRLVLNNLERRFDYFDTCKWIPREFFSRHKMRYEFVRDFYLGMIDAGRENEHAGKNIISMHMDMVTSGKIDFAGFPGFLAESGNKQVREFAEILDIELKSFIINFPD